MSDPLQKPEYPWHPSFNLPGLENSLGHLKQKQLTPQTRHPHVIFCHLSETSGTDKFR